jgi:hypothetical protein
LNWRRDGWSDDCLHDGLFWFRSKGHFNRRNLLFNLRVWWGFRENIAFVYPYSDANASKFSGGLGESIVDIRPECVQWDATFQHFFSAGNVCATKPAAANDFDPLGAGLHRSSYRLPDGTPECDATLQLIGDIAAYQICVQFRLPDFLHIQPGSPVRQTLKLLA